MVSHDGFTLQDLVSYEKKHNEANGEQNLDGENNNLSWNCGVEGSTADPAVSALRARQVRNLLATLLLSQGVPMLCAGDEFGRTQGGNNNAYCQDNELTWLDWSPSPDKLALVDFARRMMRLRQAHPVLRRQKFFEGVSHRKAHEKDITWLQPNGREMAAALWGSHEVRALGALLAGDAIDEVDRRGVPITDNTFLILMNAGEPAVPFRLPAPVPGTSWDLVTDTSQEATTVTVFEGGHLYPLSGHSLAVFQLV